MWNSTSLNTLPLLYDTALLQGPQSRISAQQYFKVRCWLGKQDSQSSYRSFLISAEKELQH